VVFLWVLRNKKLNQKTLFNHMNVKIEQSWKKYLAPEFEKFYFKQLVNFIKNEYASKIIYPKGTEIFNAFNKTPFDKIKVVILGQDPYNKPNQANGLCFSVNEGVLLPPSLQNIYKEIKTDLGIVTPNSGNLERWAKQGVLLLNTTLTVQAYKAGSHQQKGWEKFTDAVINTIAKLKQHVVFILWGSYAKRKESLIQVHKNFVIKSTHPSPLSAYKGFFGSKPFSKTNDYLFNTGQTPIVW
jgi:uracil-DNA glycosylase